MWATDPDRDHLSFAWEILKEGVHFPYGGGGEKKPEAVTGLIEDSSKNSIRFKSPGEAGSYRLFVYVYDGKGHWATANIPFYVNP